MMDPALQINIKHAANAIDASWDLTAVNLLDNATALWLWQAWGHSVPSGLTIKPEHQSLLAKWQNQTVPDFVLPHFSVEKTLAYFSQMVWMYSGNC